MCKYLVCSRDFHFVQALVHSHPTRQMKGTENFALYSALFLSRITYTQFQSITQMNYGNSIKGRYEQTNRPCMLCPDWHQLFRRMIGSVGYLIAVRRRVTPGRYKQAFRTIPMTKCLPLITLFSCYLMGVYSQLLPHNSNLPSSFIKSN